MKHEKAIVTVLFLALSALVVAAVFASRVPPKVGLEYMTSVPVKPAPLGR